MFASLIRRKPVPFIDADDSAFESTTFTLSTIVPRPCDRRSGDRVLPTLRVAKLTSNSGEQLIRLCNVSAGGLMGEIGRPLPVGETVSVELQEIPASVVWSREGLVGVKFDHNLDLGELLAGRKPRHGLRPQPPRLQVGCKASVRVGSVYYTVDVHDISLGEGRAERGILRRQGSCGRRRAPAAHQG